VSKKQKTICSCLKYWQTRDQTININNGQLTVANCNLVIKKNTATVKKSNLTNLTISKLISFWSLLQSISRKEQNAVSFTFSVPWSANILDTCKKFLLFLPLCSLVQPKSRQEQNAVSFTFLVPGLQIF
jgi:hypothetical protein